MADQDHDGSHIKGLIINFVHHFWPSLAKMEGFLKQFITPIIKASKGTQQRVFFTVQDFQRWAEDPNSRVKTWKIKYYKGLGTSTDKEAKEYFQAIDKHQIDFNYIND
jgi:DNA topoisomerase-2